MVKFNRHTKSGLTEDELALKERKEAEALYAWFESGQDDLPENETIGSKRMTASEYNAAIRGYDAETALRMMRLHTQILKERRKRGRREKIPS
jgi:hypothetical protein